ncbi:hypothetical protein [Azospirillum sp.]|uniref:hypothetical protein n=1 Tax=Azospirillum sp. TaxID=34012 RepID=UPI002D25DC20|nr:hypothetical protein [Azospirillum sp.]HYD66531.1 hypothetical protein [Azospirillum sp.]
MSVRLSLVIDLYDLKVEAARVAKTTGEMLGRYTKGAHKLPFRVAAAIAHAKGVSLDWLATGEGPMMLKERAAPGGDSDAGRLDPLDEVLLANVVEGLELFAASEELELEPGEKARLVVLLHRMLARRRRDAERLGTPVAPELSTPEHPVPIASDIDLADIVRLAGRRTMG